MSVVHTVIKSNVKTEILDSEESKILTYIRNQKPELEAVFLKHLTAGRRGIFQRLFQGLIREGIISGKRVSWLEGPKTMIEVRLPSGLMLKAAVKDKHSLGRFDIEGDILIEGPEAAKELTHPADLLDLLWKEGLLEETSEKQFQMFKMEIRNGSANLSLALAGASVRKNELEALVELENFSTSMDWVTIQMEENKHFSPLAFYEQCVVEGHPLHPGAKTKFGIDVEEVIQYSPEWGATPNVALAAVSREFCRTASADAQSVTDWLYKEYKGLKEAVEKILSEKGVNPAQFELVPIHPWQFDHTLGTLYKEEIAQNKVILITDFRIPTQSLVSFRSLAPIQERGQKKHHIKTAINVQTTSAVRTVSPNSAENGPVLSKILSSIQEKENHFGGSFTVLQERAGVYFQPISQGMSEDERWKLQANMASILRENPENHVKDPEEIPMPAAALLAKSPVSGKAIVTELIEQLADQYQLSRLEEAASLFIRRYAEISLPGFLTLMVRYGISLEGHMQNSISVFRKGEPVRILLRDFGGIRVFPKRLRKEGYDAKFFPGSSIMTEKVEQLRNIITYSVIQNHFAELITSIDRELGINEGVLWKQVIIVCEQIFAELKKNPDIAEQAALDELAIFQPMIDLKALTMMRLRGDVTDYPYVQVPNPLLEWKGETVL